MIPLWHDRERDLLVYDSPQPERLAALPGASRLHNGYVVVPPTLYNLQMLRWLHHPVIEPLRAYDWPGKFTPFAAQRTTANFLALNPRAFVFSDMGTGKTLAALWAADHVMRQYEKGQCRCLIVAPLSTLQRVWADAIFQALLGRRTFVVLYGDAKKREELLAQQHDFYIVNFDGLGVGAPSDSRQPGRGLFAALLQRPDIRMALVDEASAYRDGMTKRHRVARRILAPKDYLWMMTGTPTPNGPTDAYGLAKLVNNAHGESFTSYKSRVMYRLTQFKWLPRAGAMGEARKLLQPAVRFAIEDCIDLPPCTIQMREVEFSPAQRKAYDTLKQDLVLSLKSGKVITAANEAVLRLKLIQVSCIARGTEVLTEQRGWRPIEEVTAKDRVWDGKFFVTQGGAICRGEKKVIQAGSVWTTPDHLLLSDIGTWEPAEQFSAQSSARSYGMSVRLPDSAPAIGNYDSINAEGSMAVSMHMRTEGRTREPEFAQCPSSKRPSLRMSSRRELGGSWAEWHTTISNLDTYEAAMRRPDVQRLSKLRRTWNQGVQTLAQFSSILEGHGRRIRGAFNIGAQKQRRQLHTEKLSLGDAQRTAQQSTPPVAMVYDLLNCGPRQRFVIRGAGGDLWIAHNCGAIYGENHEVHHVDAAPRLAALREVLEQTREKIIVFAPLTSVIGMLHKELKDEVSCAVINGTVSPKERNKVFSDFQESANPRVLLADPQTMSHGLTLTAAATIVWYGPVDRTELFLQANKRIDRPGQTKATTIVQLASTPVEREIYRRLAANEQMQGVMLRIVREEG